MGDGIIEFSNTGRHVAHPSNNLVTFCDKTDFLEFILLRQELFSVSTETTARKKNLATKPTRPTMDWIFVEILAVKFYVGSRIEFRVSGTLCSKIDNLPFGTWDTRVFLYRPPFHIHHTISSRFATKAIFLDLLCSGKNYFLLARKPLLGRKILRPSRPGSPSVFSYKIWPSDST